MTNARQKLNSAALHGIVLMAGLIAFLAESWIIFWLLALILLISALHAGDIRLKNRR
jgi:hypothetical protein